MEAKLFAVSLCFAMFCSASARYVNYPPEVVRGSCYPDCERENEEAKQSHQVADVPIEPGYPAGVNSNLCPNYPFCGPSPVHVKSNDQAIWAVPKSSQPPSPFVVNQKNTYEETSRPNPQYFVPSNAPSYNNRERATWTPPAIDQRVPLAPFHYSAQGGVRYPANVDPNSCPNYPYCRV